MKTKIFSISLFLASFLMLFSISASAQGGPGNCGSVRAQGCIGDDVLISNCSSLPGVIEYTITQADAEATPGPGAFFCVTIESNSYCETHTFEGFDVSVGGSSANGVIKGRPGEVIRVEPAFGAPTGIVCFRRGELFWSLRVKE